jgi:hypothetical protein
MTGIFSIDISNSNIILNNQTGIITCINLPVDTYSFTINWILNSINVEYFINFQIKPNIYYSNNETYTKYNSICFSELPIVDPSNNEYTINSKYKINNGILDFSNYDVGFYEIKVNILMNNICNYTNYKLYVLPEINYNLNDYICNAFSNYYTEKPNVSQYGGIFSISGHNNFFSINQNTGIICANAPTNIYNVNIYYYKNQVYNSTTINFYVNPILSYNKIITNSNIIGYSENPISNEVIDGSFNIINYIKNISINNFGIINYNNLIPNIYLVNIKYIKNNCSIITNCKIIVNPYLSIISPEQTINYGSSFEYVYFEPFNIKYSLICDNNNILIYSNYFSLENIKNIGKYTINLTLNINNQLFITSYNFNILPNIFYPNQINYGLYNQEFISDLPIINPINSNIFFYLKDNIECINNTNYINSNTDYINSNTDYINSNTDYINSNTGYIKVNNLDVGEYKFIVYYTYLDFQIPIHFLLIIKPVLIIPDQNIIYSNNLTDIIINPIGGILNYDLSYSILDAGNYKTNISYTYNNIISTKEININILKKKLDLKLFVIDKYYDDNLIANIICIDISNIIIEGYYDNPNTSLHKNVFVKYIKLPEYLDINYFTDLPKLTGNIYPQIINPKVITFDKIYDGTNKCNISIDCKYLLSYDANFLSNNVGLQNIFISNLIINNNNFVFSSESYTVSANILPKNVYLTFTVNDKIFDENNLCEIALKNIKGLIKRDNIVLNNIIANFSTCNVGYNPVNIISYQISGNNCNNYNLIFDNLSGNILPQIINLDFKSIDKIYDGNNCALINYCNCNSYYLDKNVNIKKIINITNIIFENNNYHVPNCKIYGNILPFMLEFNFTGNDKVYDGNTICNGSYFINSISGDIVDCIFNCNFKNFFCGENKELIISNLKLIGKDSINYKINSIKINKPNITKKELFVEFISIDKMYDKTNIAFVKACSVSGFIDIQNIEIIKIDALFDDYNCGTNKLINIKNIVLGPKFINYFISDTICYGNILAQELNLDIDSIIKDYDSFTNVELNIKNVNNVLPYDIVYLESYQANFLDSEAGTSKIVNINNISLLGDSAHNYICKDFSLLGTINKKIIDIDISALDQYYEENLIPKIICNYDILHNAKYLNIEIGQQEILISDIIYNNNFIIYDKIIYGNIMPKKVNLNFKAIDKIYDSTTNVTITYDSICLAFFNSYFEDSNIGYKKIFINDISLNNLNYITDLNIIIYANILPIEIKIDPIIEKYYDGSIIYNNLSYSLITNYNNILITNYDATFADPNIGESVVSINNIVLNNNNYFINNFKTKGIIKPMLLNIQFNIEDKIYDKTNKVNIISISSTINVISYQAFYNSPNVGLNTVHIEKIILSNKNYKCSNLLLYSNIKPKLIDIKFVIKPKIYDKNENAIIDSYTILNKNINIISYSAKYVDSNVGLKKIIINNIILDTNNYYASEYVCYSNINPRLLKINFTNLNKIYDKTNHTNIEVNLIDNIIENDDVKISFFNSQYEDFNVNNNISILCTNITLIGDDCQNYYVNDYKIKGNILPKPLEPLFSYENNVIIGSLKGIINNDNIMIKNYISYKHENKLNIQNITLTGSNKNNYILSNNNYLINII